MFQDNNDIRFIFAGGGAAKEKVIAAAHNKNLRNVIFIDRQPKEAMPQIWSLCDVSLVPLINNPLFETVIPSKIFECMAMGLPVIMSVPKGEATEIVEKNNTGLVVEPECKEGIANAIIELYKNPDKKEELKQSSIKSSKVFNREVLANKMLDILAKLSRN